MSGNVSEIFGGHLPPATFPSSNSNKETTSKHGEEEEEQPLTTQEFLEKKSIYTYVTAFSAAYRGRQMEWSDSRGLRRPLVKVLGHDRSKFQFSKYTVAIFSKEEEGARTDLFSFTINFVGPSTTWKNLRTKGEPRYISGMHDDEFVIEDMIDAEFAARDWPMTDFCTEIRTSRNGRVTLSYTHTRKAYIIPTGMVQ